MVFRPAGARSDPRIKSEDTLDDATSALLSAFLVEEEGTASTFRKWVAGMACRCAFLRIGAAIIFPQPLLAERSTDRISRRLDALAHLGVEHIAAYSPQARGRSERVFHTLQDRLTQDRLTKELALAAIAMIEAANAFIRDVYVPAHNARFAVEAEQEGARLSLQSRASILARFSAFRKNARLATTIA